MPNAYHVPQGGLPGQDSLLTGRAVFTESYAVIPRGTQSDIVVSYLPFWAQTRAWVLSRPMSGFSETFSHYLMEVAPGGGSETPEPDRGAEGVLFGVGGVGEVTIDGASHQIGPGTYIYLPPGTGWRLTNPSNEALSFHWIRKAYVAVDGIDAPDVVIADDKETPPSPMPDTDGAWATTLFTDPKDMRHDMAVTIVTLRPGAVIPFEETHVMEHGLFVLNGKAVYRLNQDWVEVEAGDYMWLRAFCPQACYAGGPKDFRYLLYKDVNRHMPLTLNR